MSPSGSFRRRVDSISLEEPGRSPRQACVCYLADEGVIFGKADKPQTPRKQPPFSGIKGGFAEPSLTGDFHYSIVTFLTDAPLAQLDRALDYELLRAPRLSPRLSSVFIRLGPPPNGQEVTG